MGENVRLVPGGREKRRACRRLDDQPPISFGDAQGSFPGTFSFYRCLPERLGPTPSLSALVRGRQLAFPLSRRIPTIFGAD